MKEKSCADCGFTRDVIPTVTICINRQSPRHWTVVEPHEIMCPMFQDKESYKNRWQQELKEMKAKDEEKYAALRRRYKLPQTRRKIHRDSMREE